MLLNDQEVQLDCIEEGNKIVVLDTNIPMTSFERFNL